MTVTSQLPSFNSTALGSTPGLLNDFSETVQQVCDYAVRRLVMRNRVLRNIENQLTFIRARRAGRLR